MNDHSKAVQARYRIDPEITGETCGFDFEHFTAIGYDCPSPATVVIIEGTDFHYAHLCVDHASLVMDLLEALQR